MKICHKHGLNFHTASLGFIYMFGFNRSSSNSRQHLGIWSEFRHWFAKHCGGYQPNRTYMRGPKPASNSSENGASNISHAS